MRDPLIYSEYRFISLEILVYKAFKSEHTVCLLFYLLRCIAHSVLLRGIRNKRNDQMSKWLHEIEEREREGGREKKRKFHCADVKLFLNYDTNATYIFNLKWIKCIKIDCFHLHVCFTASHKYSPLEMYTRFALVKHIQLVSLDSKLTSGQIIFHYCMDCQRLGKNNDYNDDNDNERWLQFQKPLHF